jgi:hypothetical protein
VWRSNAGWIGCGVVGVVADKEGHAELVRTRVLKSGWVWSFAPFGYNCNCNWLVNLSKWSNQQPDYDQLVVIGCAGVSNQVQLVVTQPGCSWLPLVGTSWDHRCSNK